VNLPQLTWRALTADKPFIKGLIGDAAAIGKLHAALFIADAKAEAARLQRKVLLLAAASAAIAIAVVFLLGGIVASCWDTPYRMYALFGAPLSLAVLGGVLYALATAEDSSAKPFERTTAELANTAEWAMDLI